MPDATTQLSPNKQALLKIRELRQQLEEAETSRGYEPIAIVSMACRFPRRANTPEAFWQSLIDKTDEVSEVPNDRWDMEAFHDEDPDIPGKMYARHGVFLDNIDLMDPEFFGISPREATWVDPQQRLLMEVGWEALERAGWVPEQIGEHTGIFVGWMHNDYQNEASDSFLNLNPYIATGAAGSFLCGRLAYYLGLQGPSLAVDTACSSSLVALHLACLSLQRGDCDRALVGGVNAICSPTTNILTCKLKALSPNGHSRAFDAAADGYLRGEGCGVVTVRRLSDAQRDGDPILGVINGSAVGHNGAGGGLTVPNPKAQEKVIRAALRRAQLSPGEVSYLEAHGTGTELGDPIELQAAAAALATDRNGSGPLLVGSVKTNIGHLEAAAGMAGLIKVLLALQNDSIPGQLNFETPNPHIPWDRLDVKVLTDATDWPGKERIAGVSAFGMSGTNAHVLIAGSPGRRWPGEPASSRHVAQPSESDKQAPTVKEHSNSSDRSSPKLIVLSGRTEEALCDLADEYLEYFRGDDSPHSDLGNVAYTTTTGRSHFEHRAAVVATNHEEAIAGLQTIARNDKKTVKGTAKRPPKVAWQFTGQGSQYVGMAKDLYNSEPIFRDIIDYCDKLLTDWRDDSLKSVLFDDDAAIHHTSWTQPAIFAVQMGLAKLLEQHGLAPELVLGHSVGQYAAACVAGIMSWDDGLRLIAERGRLIGELPSSGLMIAVFASRSQVEDALQECSSATSVNEVSVAAYNGTHVVVSGKTDEIERVETLFTEKSIRSKRLTTSHAFHSSLMEPALEPFQAFADQMTFHRATIPLVCNISGKLLSADTELDGAYWANHIRQPVAFAESINTAQELGCEIVLELGPQAILTRMAAANWQGAPNHLLSCLDRNVDNQKSLLNAIATLHVNGAKVDFAGMHAGKQQHSVLLPTYPFQRRRFWGPDKPRAAHAEHHTAHPLLGEKISLAGIANETRYESFVDSDSPAWLPDHEVIEQTVLPGAAYIEMAIAAIGKFPAKVTGISFEQPLSPRGRTPLQTVIRKTDDTATIETYSSAGHDAPWTKHFNAALDEGHTVGSPTLPDLGHLRNRLTEKANPADFYAKMRDVGLNYGPAFRTIREIRYSESEVLTKLETNGDIRGFQVPPTLLDGALHSLAVGLLRKDDGNLFLPVAIEAVACFRPVANQVWCHAQWVQNEGPQRSANLTLFTESDGILMSITGLQVKQISRAVLRQMSGAGARRLIYELQWEDFRLPARATDKRQWLVIGDDSAATAIAAELTAAGHEVKQCSPAEVPALAGSDDQSNFVADGIAWLVTDDTESNCTGILALVNQLAASNSHGLPCGLNFLTQHGVAIQPGDNCEPEQAKYWGLGRVIGAEQPALRCRLLDVNSKEPSIPIVAEFLQTETRDNQLALRNGHFFAPRLKAVPAKSRDSFSGKSQVHQRTDASENNSNLSPREDASYLITGGLGKLGRQAAKWLAENGAGQVVLVSRRQPDAATEEFLQEVSALGCGVVVHNADLSSRNDVAALFAQLAAEPRELAGIIHAAGVLDDGLLADQSWERFKKVLAPKVEAAKLLDEFSRSLKLDFFVLYSSVAAVLGSRGQSNYAAGNAFLDGLAWQRRSSGLPATSINWGPWTEGMADDDRIRRQMALQGITPLSAEEAHQCMESILTNGIVQAMVLDVDWRRMQMGLGPETPPLLEGLAPARQRSQLGDSAFVGKLKQVRGSAQKELLVKTVQELLQQILSTSDAPETDRPLIELGLDSLMAVEFSTQLQMMLGEAFVIAPTMLFDHPTIDAISDHVLSMLDEDDADSDNANTAATSGVSVDDEPAVRVREPIAIVGMSCRFPGAKNIDEFWDNILNGVDSVGKIPEDRWDIDRFYSADREPGKMYTREGGFLDDIADFDAAFFNISDQEACWIDPQHRMLLENSYRALEDAGISPHPLADSSVGVFMGIMGQDYAFLPTLDDKDVVAAFQGAGLSHSAGVGRVSYVFGFEGPSVAVDTASSSSLVALYQAVRSLQDGDCNMALAGGVNAILAPVNSLLMSKAGLLSPDGRCKSFSAAADGFGRGEGCGVVVLKRLSDAQRDGDRIMAVVRGGAVVHNGAGGGITAPSGKSQARVIAAALKDAKVAPSQVQYLEAHGTGTEFGDPMELGAAASVYGKGRKRDNPLLVGSVKANISHLEAAGGISGLIKTVLAIHHGVIPPQAHFEEPSPHIPWKRMPVKIVADKTVWPEAEERLAGVTALGLVGTNAHVVLSSPPVESASLMIPGTTDDDTAADSILTATCPSQLLVMSARNEKALLNVARLFEQQLSNGSTDKLADICHTASTGRQHYEYRIALTASSKQDAVSKLKASIGNSANDEGLNFGVVSSKSPKLAWVFTGGENANIDSAARELYAIEPVFRNLCHEFTVRLDEHCAGRKQPKIDLHSWMENSSSAENCAAPSANVKLYVLQAGLAQLWQSWGIDPDVIVGFGVGQFTASCMAGGLCFKDALTLVVQRDISLATASEESFGAFEAFADTVNYYPPNIPLICSTSGNAIPVQRSLAGSYWREQLTAEPAVAESLTTLFGEKCEVVLEIGPEKTPELTVPAGDESKTFNHLTSLEANQPATSTTLRSLGRLYAAGFNPKFAALNEARTRQRVRLPLYPFQKQRYWITEVSDYLMEPGAS